MNRELEALLKAWDEFIQTPNGPDADHTNPLLSSKLWRKGVFTRPFCHLVLKATRVDSPPLEFNGQPLRKLLLESRLQAKLTRKALGTKLGVSMETIKNWEAGRVIPNKRFWPAIRGLIKDVRVVPPPPGFKGQAPRSSPAESPFSVAALSRS